MSSQALSLARLDASPPPGLDEALARAGRLVSDRVGVIADALFMETSAEEPQVYFAQSRPAKLPVAGRHALNAGSGTSVNPDRAAMKAAGEAIERYCSAFYDESELIFGTYDEMAGKALRPEDFSLFSTQQYSNPDFPFAPFTRQTPVRWVSGHSLVGDCATLAPASYVYIPYQSAQDEPPLKDLISTGLACGTTYASALLKALGEVVERDAFTIVWRNRLRRPHIDLEEIGDPLIRQLVQVFRRLPIEVSAVLITLDIPIPVILVLMTRSDGPPWTIVASGADVSPRVALLLALEEACLALIGMGRMVAAAGDYRPAADYSDLTTLLQHGLAHAVDPRLRSATAFLAKPTEIVKLSELRDLTTGNPVTNLRAVLKEISPLVTDIVGIDVTTSDIDEVGFKVVRVVVPEMQPMDDNHLVPHLGGRRLYDVPWKLGLAPRPKDPSELNPDPHPFP